MDENKVSKTEANKGLSCEKVPKYFDEAVALTGYGVYHIYVLLATGGCLMCVIIETLCAMFILPSAQCDLKLGLTEKGILACISFLGVISTSHLWGFLADTKGRKKILVFCLLASALVSFVCCIVPWAWLFILLRFVNGALIGGSSAIIYAYTGEFHDNLYRPKVISWMCTFVAFGQIYIPALAWIILPQEWVYDIPSLDITFRPWRLLVIIYALPSIVVAGMLAILPESPKFLLSQGKQKETLQILKRMFHINTRKDPEEYLVSEIMFDETYGPKHEQNEGLLLSMWKQTVPFFSKQYLVKSILVCYMQFGIFLSASALALWYPEILNSMAKYSTSIGRTDIRVCESIMYDTTQTALEQPSISWVENNDTMNIFKTRITNSDECVDYVDPDVFLPLVISGISIGCTYIFVGCFINIIGKKIFLIGLVTITGAAGICAQYFSGYIYIQVFCGIYLLVAASIGIVNALVVDIYPTQIRAMALAVSLMFGRLGALMGSSVVGTMFYYYCDYLFWFFAANHLVIIIVVILLRTGPTKTKENTNG